MKRFYPLIAFMFTISGITLSQTTATDFTAADCNNTSHTLFSELNSGKVVVITWVMPCGACINGASTAASTVQGYASSNPGKVVFYLVDDYANTNCSTLKSWASTNSITANAVFSNASISMSNYGTDGMPKTIVVGGSSHSVYYNENGNGNAADLKTAIDKALIASGIGENMKADFKLTVFPNPVSENLSISYSLPQTANIKLEIVNVLGKKIKDLVDAKQVVGQQTLSISSENLIPGIYFLKITSENNAQFVKFLVSR